MDAAREDAERVIMTLDQLRILRVLREQRVSISRRFTSAVLGPPSFFLYRTIQLQNGGLR